MQIELSWLGRVPAVGFDELAGAPRLLVVQEACKFGPASIGDSSGQPVVGQHPGHVQVLDDEPVVGFDQLVGYPVQEVAAHMGDVMMMTPQLGCGVAAVR